MDLIFEMSSVYVKIKLKSFEEKKLEKIEDSEFNKVDFINVRHYLNYSRQGVKTFGKYSNKEKTLFCLIFSPEVLLDKDYCDENTEFKDINTGEPSMNMKCHRQNVRKFIESSNGLNKLVDDREHAISFITESPEYETLIIWMNRYKRLYAFQICYKKTEFDYETIKNLSKSLIDEN